MPLGCRYSTKCSIKIQPEMLTIGMRERAGWGCKVHRAAMACRKSWYKGLVQRAGAEGHAADALRHSFLVTYTMDWQVY